MQQRLTVRNDGIVVVDVEKTSALISRFSLFAIAANQAR